MARTFFFSWQEDTPQHIGKEFITNVLQDVCKSFAIDDSLSREVREIVLDSDTRGVPGQPPVTDTIFKKIDAATVLLSDLTFTGARLDGRPIPNPNVLIEYAWGIKTLTYERVLCIMNTHFGTPSRDKPLPFNMNHLKWPTLYTLAPDASAVDVKKERDRLAKVLRDELLICLAAAPVIITPLEPSFSQADFQDGPARFRKKGEALGYDSDFPFGNGSEVFLKDGPAMWLRLMPTNKQSKHWPIHVLMKKAMEANTNLLPLIHPGGGYDFVQSEDGVGMYRAAGLTSNEKNTKSKQIDSVAFIFDTGEIWSIETAYLSWDTDKLPFLESYFSGALLRYGRFLKELGIEPRYKWVAGLIGIKGRHLLIPTLKDNFTIGPGPICTTDKIEIAGTYDGSESAIKALLPFFETIFDKCVMPRPDYLPQE